jgi:superfamily II DNA/RNA helicase
MFSATFCSSIKNIASNFLNTYYYVSKADDLSTNKNIKHEIFYIKEEEKLFRLHSILQKIKGLVISKSN